MERIVNVVTDPASYVFGADFPTMAALFTVMSYPCCGAQYSSRLKQAERCSMR